MKPEKQRIAIAEACALKPYNKPLIGFDGTKLHDFWVYDGPLGVQMLPDYLHDLNAMHEAEKVLTEHQWAIYSDVLFGVAPFLPPNMRTATATRYVIHATAAQRAEAFLRTIGKWEEAP